MSLDRKSILGRVISGVITGVILMAVGYYRGSWIPAIETLLESGKYSLFGTTIGSLILLQILLSIILWLLIEYGGGLFSVFLILFLALLSLGIILLVLWTVYYLDLFDFKEQADYHVFWTAVLAFYTEFMLAFLLLYPFRQKI